MLDVQYKVVPSGTSVVLTVNVTLPPSFTLELLATGLAVGTGGVYDEPEYVGPVILKEADPLIFGVALLVSTYRVCVPVTAEVLAQLRRTVNINFTGPST